MRETSFGKRLLSMLLALAIIIGLGPVADISGWFTKASAAEGETIYVLAGGDFQEAGDHANSAANVTNILAQVSQKYDTMDGFLFIGDYDCETHNDATETANGITALMGAVQGSYSNLNDANSVLAQGNHDYMDSRIDATGGHEFEGYAAYVLNEDDYPNGGGSQSGSQTLANNLKTWLNNKIGEGYTAPIFIVSHLPLAYTPRTVTQGDAKYAKYIFDVLNDAGKNGLNIIFLHGHDHAYGPDNYMGGEAIYLPVGDKICIAEAGSTSAWTEETLNFTYMNAGYTGYYSDAYTYVTTAGTDKLTMTVFAITDNQVTVERYSEDGLYNLKSAGYNGSYSNTSVDNVSLGLPMYSNVYTSPQTITLTDNGAADMGTIGNWIGIEAESTDDVTTSGNSWVTITEPVAGSTTYAYELATSITAGQKYVIVGNDHAIALQGTTSMGTQSVTISNTTMTSATELTEWTFSSGSSGTIYNGTRYLRYNNSAFGLSTSSTTFTITDNGSNFRIRSGNYSFYYNGSSWTRSGRNTAQYVRLFVRNEDGDVTTGGTPGLYGMVDGELTYNVAAGTSAEDAIAAVKAGIDIRYHYGDANAAQTFPDDGDGMTWVLDPSYDPNVPGEYAVTISFNGTVLGTAEVVVPATTTYYAAEGNGLYLVDMNTTEANAMAAVKAGVTVYSATDASGSNKTAISDDDFTWNWVDTYNGADSGPYTVEILKDGTSLGTVEVKVNIQYETGINTDWTYIGETEATGGSYTYTLDTDGIDYGEEHKYIIVDDNEAIVLNANSSSNGTAHSITISGNTATLDTRDYEYHMIQTSYNGTRYELITKGDGSQYLYQESSGVRYGTRSSVKFQVNHHGNGVYDIHDIDGTNWYIIYNGGWTVTETTSARVRLYKYTGTTGGTPGGPIYALLEGDTVYTVPQGTSATKALAAVKAGITGYTATAEDGTGKTELADSDLKWTWKNTFNGNSTGSYWVEISYQGKVLGTVEVKVKAAVINNYPEYPDEGAVKVNKTATGIDFQSSGVAQVELSTSGVASKKGADVIIMLDTSSSMAYCLDCDDTRHSSYVCDQGGQTRAQALEEALADLITQFKTPGADGELLDIDVAIADFNGFYGDNHSESGTPYDRDAADTMSDDIAYTANSEAKVYTGDGSLGSGAFISAEDLATSYTLNYTSGTNYDYAFDAIYQMATAKKEASSEDRDLYVIFMSDGAGMQWNYYHSQGGSSLWNSWITGAWSADEVAENLNCATHAYYYDEVDHDGDGYINEHRMANAIKGNPSEQYEVIRKVDTLGTLTGEDNMYMVPGLGAKLFSIAYDPRVDTNVTVASITKSIASLASDQTGTTQYFYNVSSADELSSAFNVIGVEIAYAASNARFVDQMGNNFNLQMKPITYDVVNGTDKTSKTLEPVIEILSYDIWTRQDYLENKCTEDKIGVRKGTSELLEVVKFDANGKAYSDKIDVDKDGIYGVTINADGTYTISDADDNIIGNDGVIYAQTFLYNGGSSGVAVTGVDIPTGDKTDGTVIGSSNVLPKETFYWKLGTVQTTELAMRYYVYLDGSMEGTKEAGSYATNNFAILYYDNYLGNACKIETTSPSVAWKSANISYAFYLVNEKGEVIVNQTTGQTGTFANKIAVTNPVLFDEVLLNNDGTIKSLNVASLDEGVLPKYYKLYDESSAYYIAIHSDSTGEWRIDSANHKWSAGVDEKYFTDDDILDETVTREDLVNSTYVTHFSNDVQYSNELQENQVGYDYTHTVVWFAVVWTVEAHPDSVVMDFGLPVDIHVMTNDMFGAEGALAGIGAFDALPAGYETAIDATLRTGFGTTYTGAYGEAKADLKTGVVRYTPTKMEMNGYERFAYAVNCTDTDKPGYYYDTITVIPATSIYYEDDFLTYTASGTSWTDEGTAIEGATQDEDRPGKYSLTDANNIYGYDSVNLGMSTYSMGTAKKVHVDANSYATATFSFYGTGFDVISMTSNMTGVLTVQVRDSDGELQVSKIVDTYYGYKQEAGDANGDGTVADGEMIWVVDPDASKSLYQIPVIKVSDLAYGQYTVTLRASYYDALNNVGSTDENGKFVSDGSYDLYVDAIRIYDPANDGAVDSDNVIEDAYKADGEGWPSYLELRNMLIDNATLGNAATGTKVEGLVFIDGDASVGDAQIENYKNYGPNNEVYLAPGQRVAFILNTPDNIANVHIGLKSADGKTATYTITNIARATNSETGVTAGDYYAAKTDTVNTATEMYYDITGYKGDIIVISNTGDKYNTTGVLSITNIKSTYTSNPTTVTSNGGAANNDAAAASYRLSAAPAAYSTLATANELATVSDGTETIVTNETTVYMTAEAAALAVQAVNAMEAPEEPEAPAVPEEPEVFQPEKLEISLDKGKVKEGEKVKVNVRTSDDVAYITVNGETVTRYKTDRRTGDRIWTVQLRAEEAGNMTIEAIAYNEDGLASEAATAIVKVQAKKKSNEDIIRDILDWLFG